MESCDVCKNRTLHRPSSGGDRGLGQWWTRARYPQLRPKRRRPWAPLAVDLGTGAKCLKATLPFKFLSLPSLSRILRSPVRRRLGAVLLLSGVPPFRRPCAPPLGGRSGARRQDPRPAPRVQRYFHKLNFYKNILR